MKKKFVILSGAGISAESGISTFRDSDGLWENHKIEEVATPEGWQKNADLVTQFYNTRRQQIMGSKPNTAHEVCVALEDFFDVTIITQNIDDLHERAGSKKVMHLHGEIMKARSTINAHLLYDVKKANLNKNDVCELGSRLRPHIVWFGEEVPLIPLAVSIIEQADELVIVGTSMQVYPAASLALYAPMHVTVYYIDPQAKENVNIKNKLVLIKKSATLGMHLLKKTLLKQ